MVVYTFEQRFANSACDRLTEDADFGKKSSFQDDLGTHTLKSRRTQNESLFGADFDPEA